MNQLAQLQLWDHPIKPVGPIRRNYSVLLGRWSATITSVILIVKTSFLCSVNSKFEAKIVKLQNFSYFMHFYHDEMPEWHVQNKWTEWLKRSMYG